MEIGFIGLGTMGIPMALNILNKMKKTIHVYDISEKQKAEMAEHGAVSENSAEDVVNKSDIIITMVPTSKNVEDLYEKILTQNIQGKIFIDMSTIDPKVSIKTAEKTGGKGAVMLDAPVVKSKAAAEKGELGIYVGGDYGTYEEVKDILRCMGKNIIYMGENGQGLVMKICHNILVGMIQNGVNEVLTLAEKLGIDYEKFVTAISYGGGQNFYLDSKWETIKRRDFEPAFSVQNMNKDVNLACDLQENCGLDLPGFEHIKEIYSEAMEKGFGNEDFSASFKVVKKEL
ncbi:NAD(P)-dependent oxidoreductase [Sebaldella sp. S0638]|uniref:NAD(P)-dependent oxidoreductase n=1 Tax=Sebaldella sp. S0638 TaxID=2957809 RepID=UPI0020A04AF1|nr:NAD(P)-dependent oxidoreductase [Sebaldella sp. S0638]MCP1223859.1 NAD(P)-dependent oxidoreductase [Sebaldella sp. S0638]